MLDLATTSKKQRRASSSEAPPSKTAPPEASVSPTTMFWLFAALALIVVCTAYANHFHNSFHFDDSHTIQDNIYIRDLHNIPRFFTDATTFSSLPSNQTWRPIVSMSLAIDYHLAHGYDTLWFHISTFFWFLVQLALMYAMYESILRIAAPAKAISYVPYVALFAVAWYGLHPAIAETVNYIIQRGDLYATLGVVAGLLLWIRAPKLRITGLYLVPVAIGSFAKTPSVVFCGILLVYIFLFEENGDWKRFQSALVRSIPAFAVCIALAVMNIKLTSKSFSAQTMPSSLYWLSQPYVLLRYVRSLFLPLWLSADTDLRPVAGLGDPTALLSLLGCLALLAVALWCIKQREHRPIAFGIFWFFGASAPTSLFVLSELENDHRMFFPFVGLMLSVTWAIALYIFGLLDANPQRRKNIVLSVQVLAGVLLLAYAYGTWQRNIVWHTEESLWHDVSIKSPENGRGLMNYGLSLMGRGDMPAALDYFTRAAVYTPNYATLEINTAIALDALKRSQEGETHFRKAIQLAPRDAQTYHFYGRYLKQQGRTAEAIANLKSAIALNPPWVAPRYLLMQIYQEQGDAPALQALAQDTLQYAPADPASQRYLAASRTLQSPLEASEKLASSQPTAEHYLDLSLQYNKAGKYEESIAAARKALKLKPDYPEAYNNIAAADESLARWNDAIDAAQHALKINPNFTLAKNNLNWSLSQKKLQQAKH